MTETCLGPVLLARARGKDGDLHVRIAIPGGSIILIRNRNAIAGGNTVGPLICGFVVGGLGWRWHKWIAVILTAINFVAVVLFVPETRYQRTEARSNVSVAARSSCDKNPQADLKSIRRPSDDELQQLPKKTFMQELSLWSGSPSTNLFKMFIRYIMMDSCVPLTVAKL
jgi:MFS family permease